MAYHNISLAEPAPLMTPLHEVFGSDLEVDNLSALGDYCRFYHEELKLLRTGVSKSSWQSQDLAVKTHVEILHVIAILRNNTHARRVDIRNLLSAFAAPTVRSLNTSINLALRLWLMINVQDTEFTGLRHGVTSIHWGEDVALQDFLCSLFSRCRWQATGHSNRLGPHFTAAFMQRVCGLRIEWTTSLHDHLRLDRVRRALKIFPYKCQLRALIHSHRKCNRPVALPIELLEETMLSLDLLFPFWDSNTIKLLAKEGQTFHKYGPFNAERSLSLVDFDYWRDRLLELHEEIFQSPPVSWAQLWRDRRNPQQFWTFWLAFMILLLTLLSTIASIVQAWAAVKALKQIGAS